MSSGYENPGERTNVFATTHWSVVAQAGEASPAATDALEKLCRAYWYPVYAEVRRRGHRPPDAQDLTQEFFASLLRSNTFARADKSKGRFRSYLLGALNYFLSDQSEYQHRIKRGGTYVFVSLEEQNAEGRYLAEPATEESPEALFDRRWREALLSEAYERLRQEHLHKKDTFEELKRYLGEELNEANYAQSAIKLGLKPGAVAVAVHRLRRRYAELVRERVKETLLNSAEADDELRQLFS